MSVNPRGFTRYPYHRFHRVISQINDYRDQTWCINICWAPREVLKPEPERQGFQHLTRGTADVNVSERMFDRYYCIKTSSFFFAPKLWRNCFKTFSLPVPIMTQISMLPANVLKMPLPGQRLMSSLLCTLLMMTSVFMTALECLFVKPQSRALTALIALLIHGFVLVQTWLLIACDTAFYAILLHKYIHVNPSWWTWGRSGFHFREIEVCIRETIRQHF